MKKVILALMAFCVSISAMQQDILIQESDVLAPQPMHMDRSDLLSPLSSIKSDASTSSRSSTPIFLSEPETQETECDRFKNALCLACCGCCMGCMEIVKILTKKKIKSE